MRAHRVPILVLHEEEEEQEEEQELEMARPLAFAARPLEAERRGERRREKLPGAAAQSAAALQRRTYRVVEGFAAQAR